jgi:GNAT superfamily N-acetyltransferase
MELATAPLMVATAHPSLDDAIRRFCAELRAESRYFGRRGAAAPKPARSSIRRLESSEPAIEIAAVVDGAVIGLARLDDAAPAGPELLIAVAQAWRGRGVALALGREIVARARGAGVPRIVLRTSHRRSDLRELGNALGFQVFDLGRGRVDLVRSLEPAARSA